MRKNLNDLKKRIKNKIPHLTESQKVIADYIIESPERFVLSSIREIARDSKISKSTIVRLAQALGYNGVYEMKSAFLESIRHELDPIDRYKTFLSNPTDEKNFLSLIAKETISNINSTLKLIDEEQFKKVVHLLEAANHVHTMGLGISTYLAEFAYYLFNRVSIKSFTMQNGLTFAEQIVNFERDDVIFAFSFPPYSRETIQAASYAQEKRIKVISVTNKVTSEIVQYSDISLQVAAESITGFNSIGGVMVLLYSLSAQIGKDLRIKTLETIESIQHVRKEHSV